ncbi:coiled-coil domain-containing protein 160 [Hyla sarda]|uniref:coiled-coil domain-containing protein 160 n=1 Tax=Hyla sarda TaxID=327740 RepID=UPI0024C469A7|nr:coiled-coil domain-containing protein 160 [Hyla sarda]XP_056395217.1 coiled-coil domain-containing protein 160 [Hyla sarda]XP_056395218.1 coiled-coil domain-containing protein 160 [Hyla sarda]XP_056395219.1 coiled-coil domain-containing protein 160 [Hyla sarda]
MENNKKHWIEELFSPHFSAESFEAELLISEKQAKERAQKVEAIYKDVLCEFQENETKKKRDLLSKMIIHESSVQDQPGPAQHATCESCQKANNDSASASKSSRYCIWNEKELNLLRSEMNEKHSEGAHLSLQLSACKLEISELKAKQKETERELEALKMALAASKRANECKRVLINELKKEGEKKEANLQALRKDMHKKCAVVQELTTSMSNAREEKRHLQLRNTELQQEMSTLQQQQQLKVIIASEKTKLRYDAQIKKLQQEIETLKEERRVERHQRGQDVAELEFLRKLYINEK